MSDQPPGFSRTYSPKEWAAARRVGIANDGTSKNPRGPLVYAGGPYYPDMARKMADDWSLIADALEREWRADS